MIDAVKLAIGDEIAEQTMGPISRHILALFCGGSGDHHPIHVDIDYARDAGFDDVFAHGMLAMAYLGQFITGAFAQEQLRSWSVRFKALTPVGATLTCRGIVTEAFEAEGERLLRLAISAVTDAGVVTVEGEAIIAPFTAPRDRQLH